MLDPGSEDLVLGLGLGLGRGLGRHRVRTRGPGLQTRLTSASWRSIQVFTHFAGDTQRRRDVRLLPVRAVPLNDQQAAVNGQTRTTVGHERLQGRSETLDKPHPTRLSPRQHQFPDLRHQSPAAKFTARYSWAAPLRASGATIPCGELRGGRVALVQCRRGRFVSRRLLAPDADGRRIRRRVEGAAEKSGLLCYADDGDAASRQKSALVWLVPSRSSNPPEFGKVPRGGPLAPASTTP
jgi:hypothetical protein